MAVRARVRQCDLSLPLDWHDDPPQDLRALLHDLFHNTLALIIILLRLIVALLQFRKHPKVEHISLHQLRPVVRSTRLDRFPHHDAKH